MFQCNIWLFNLNEQHILQGIYDLYDFFFWTDDHWISSRRRDVCFEDCPRRDSHTLIFSLINPQAVMHLLCMLIPTDSFEVDTWSSAWHAILTLSSKPGQISFEWARGQECIYFSSEETENGPFCQFPFQNEQSSKGIWCIGIARLCESPCEWST